MELTTFVAETLKQIAEGVVQADKDVEPLGATVNPRTAFSNKGLIYVSEDNVNNIKTVQVIEFDISLTETESTQAGGRIGVLFSSIGLGAHGKAESGSNAMNRVKFSVPIALPSHFCR